MRLVWFGLFCFVPSGYAEILDSVGAGEWDGTLYLQRHRFLTESANRNTSCPSVAAVLDL